MNDLIYNGEKRENHDRIKKIFIDHVPQLELEDDLDDIHGYRLAVIGEIDIKDYFGFLIDQNLTGASFLFQMSARMPGDNQNRLLEVLKDKGL